MQQSATMIPVMPSFPQANITTEQIQKYLDENKRLILAILDNQNLGKLAECAQYQAQLQKNLMYLAAIADAQPQASTMPPQMAPHPGMQHPGYFAQHPQAAAAAAIMQQQQQQQQQQQGLFGAKMPMQFNSPHQIQDPQQQLHHQAQMAAMRPNNGMHHHHPMHHPDGAKHDGSDAGAEGGSSAAANDGDDGK